IFDVAFLDTVPGMTVLCPSSFAELRAMLTDAIQVLPGPVAVRYPRGGEGDYKGNSSAAGSVVLREGNKITLVGYGMLINQVLRCADLLEQSGISAEVVKLNTITPIDYSSVFVSLKKTGRLLVAEDVVDPGCVGQRLAAAAVQAGIPVSGVMLCNLGRDFVTHGSVSQLQKLCGLDSESLYRKALEVCSHG
ncbi:MAG: transketolase C-terminal domain-containing protein, partial [Pseudoflavonifractor sp.]